MAEAAVRKDQPVFDPMATYLAFESFKDAPGPLFTGHRIDCMTGEAAEREQRIKGFANVAKLCAQLREVSADVQRDPEQLRDDSDRGILGVYTAILDLKINNRQVRKEKINEQTALRLVDAYASLAENEGMKDRAGVVSFQLPDIPNVTFNASAGMMVDVGFTRAQLAHESKGAIPAESKLSPAAFEQMQRACTENKGTIETFGACLDIGNAEYSNYLRKNRLVVSVRGG